MLSVIFADQFPSAFTCPSVKVNPVAKSSIVNKILAERRSPFLSCNELPLSLAIEPVIVKVSPATGLAAIGSTTIIVIERIVTVDNEFCVGIKSTVPL